jgi:group I intron endonuclease
MGALYRITSPSGKQYIGVTTWPVHKRFADHCKKSKSGRGYALHRAIAKYGQSAMKVETLVVADDPEYLHELEIRAISTFGTLHPNGYNLTTGGEGIMGLADAAKARRAETARGRIVSEATRQKISAAAQRQMRSPEMRRLLSSLAIGRTHSEQSKQRMSEHFSVTHRAPEMRARISEATKAAHARPEVRQKMREHAAAIWADPATRAAHADKIRRKWADPKWREATLLAREQARLQRRASAMFITNDDGDAAS